MTLYRKRIGIWIIFVVACLVMQMIVPAIPSVVVNIKQASLDRKLNKIVQELQRVEEEMAETETIVGENIESADGSEMTDDKRLDSAFGAILSTIMTSAKYIGIVITVFGIFQMVLGFKEENAEQMSSSVSLLVVGVALVGAGTLVPSLFGAPGAG